jgi:hypothetical protein
MFTISLRAMRTPDLHTRDVLLLFLAGIFLTALVMGNIIGTTKFVTLFRITLPEWALAWVPEMVRNGSVYAMTVPAGVIAYPVTFLATDLISELFGRKKAQTVVWVGFSMNLFMLLVMSINHWLPNADGISGGETLFDGVYRFMVGNTLASMFAYLTAQTIDVRLFHFWKQLTKGRHLWLRNNASTMVSQLVDTVAILTILYLAGNFGENVTTVAALVVLIVNAYLFKLVAALVDTPLFYLGVKHLRHFEEDPIVYKPDA